MKTPFTFLLTFVILAVAPAAPAQIYHQIRDFAPTVQNTGTGSYTNSDGAYAVAELINFGDTLYGTTSAGGLAGSGTIFKINTNGGGFVVLHSFTTATLNPATSQFTNSDGADPKGRLFLADDTLYGTADSGGVFGMGTVFKVTTNGSAFTVLKTFSNGSSDGAYPAAGLVLPNDTLFGTTSGGGNAGEGILFKIGTNGGGFSIVHHFNNAATNCALPMGELLRQGSIFYGTGYAGGSSGWGAVFKINTNGTGFTVLKSFPDATPGINSDGASPESRLILADGTLYGTTLRGGAFSNGTVFKVNINGSGFGVVHTFPASTANGFGLLTNADGANSQSRLVLSGDTVFGTTAYGGPGGAGTIFQVNTNGTGFTVVRPFVEINGFGGVPAAGLLFSGGVFFGTTQFGGAGNSGSIFSLTLPPAVLTILHSGANAIIRWDGEQGGYTLESSGALGPSAVWTTVTPAPTLVNGQFTVTNTVSPTPKFYQLIQ